MSDATGKPTEWFVSVNGEQSGPLTLDEVVSEAAAGYFDGRDLVWREGMAGWEPLTEVVEILDALDARGVWVSGPRDEDPDPGHSAALRAVLPVGRTGMSIIAGYLGLVSLLMPLAAPVAIPVSILAIRELKMNPERHGMGRAVFGLIGGILGIGIGILIIANMH
jgi:GYF domain 2